DSIKQRLVDQLTSPVRWSQSMQAAIADHADATFIELCPNRHLAGMMRKIDRAVKVENYNEPK
ncbi:MAG: [acyl-carrier-protein] S-malonyltransferase, partial [Planctomycetota bacterium]